MFDWLQPRRTQAVDDWEREEVYGGDDSLIDEWYLRCAWCDEEFTSDFWLVVAGSALSHAVREHPEEVKREFGGR